ncbi:MAG: hypothetical protein JWQ96_3067, partial [Segetibacter sp.]|nr:hypothetical protein [Segetibacter sp.]
LIKAQVLRFGYVQHIILDINGHAITIERDEEGHYRALAEPEKISDKNIDIELIKAVVEVLEGL